MCDDAGIIIYYLLFIYKGSHTIGRAQREPQDYAG